MKTLARKRTVRARVHLDGDADVEKISQYWGIGGRHKDLFPFLNALHRVENGKVNVVFLLPNFARDHLYRYPYSTPDDKGVKQDCFWSAFNFFNGDAPDDRVNDVDYLHEVIDRDYARIVAPSQLGDIMMLTTREGKAVHAAVYVADDLLFTKNGESFTQPWILMHMADMLDTYNVRYPSSGPLNVLYSRRKSL